MKKLKIGWMSLTLLLAILSLLPVYGQGSRSMAREAAPAVTQPTRTNILLLGTDRAAGLTDSIILLSVEEPTGQLSVLQIPRDTYAAYTQRTYKKLNGAYAALGRDGLKQFLSRALGISIPYAVALDLDCVTELVDAMGGVELEIMQPMYAPDDPERILLEPGLHTLDGRQAELFLRFRAGYANADLGRIDAQKRFLSACLQKIEGLGTAQTIALAARLLPHTETDLPLSTLVSLIRLLPNAKGVAPVMETAPGEAVQGSSGAWYYSLNRAQMINTVQRLFLPEGGLTEDEFDPDRVFDRVDHPDFHRIYNTLGR